MFKIKSYVLKIAISSNSEILRNSNNDKSGFDRELVLPSIIGI